MKPHLFALGGLLAFGTACSESTESTEIGVRTVNVSLIGGRGVMNDPYPRGGTHFFPTMFSDFDKFEVGLQNLEMLRSNNDAIRFKTNDGNDVWVDVSISWGIEENRAAYLLQFVGATTFEIEQKLVRPVARTVVRDVLNRLTSEEYYQPERRYECADIARRRLQQVLSPEGVILDQVLLGEHRFNETYEQLIRDKKVAEQEAERLTSETEAELEGKRRDLEQLNGEIDKAKALAGGESQKRQRDSDAIRYEREQQAASILLEAQAKAAGLRERAAAMAGTGGRNMVKLKVAESLKGKDILFLPASGADLRTTDMNAILTTYGVSKIPAK